MQEAAGVPTASCGQHRGDCPNFEPFEAIQSYIEAFMHPPEPYIGRIGNIMPDAGGRLATGCAVNVATAARGSALKFVDDPPEFHDLKWALGPIVLPAHDEIAASEIVSVVPEGT